MDAFYFLVTLVEMLFLGDVQVLQAIIFFPRRKSDARMNGSDLASIK